MMAVRAARIELYKFCISGERLDKDRRDAWRSLSVDTQRMLNRMWQIWLCYHAEHQTGRAIRDSLEAYKAWCEAGQKGTKPKDGLQPVPKDLSNRIYHQMSEEFPNITARVRVLLQNKWNGTIAKRKAANGNLPGWKSILLGYESIPSFTRPQPIPFDKDNATLSRPDDEYVLTLRIERLHQSEKTAKPSLVETCRLMLRKRKAANMRAIIDRVLSGEYQWKGSSLVYDRGKWYASISYEMPPRRSAPTKTGRTLYVLPGKKSPWVLLLVDEHGHRDAWRYGGQGRVIEHARRHLLDERASRKEHYRWAGSNQKSKGRSRAAAAWTKLSSRWKDLVKRFNSECANRIVNLAESRGASKIVYCQPVEGQRDKALLSRIGNYPGSAMLWDWFQAGTLLASKCEEYGLEFETQKTKHSGDDGLQNVRGDDSSKLRSGRGRKAAGVQ
jgi:transposase